MKVAPYRNVGNYLPVEIFKNISMRTLLHKTPGHLVSKNKSQSA